MDATEKCPWCGSVIARTKFVEIQTRIREEEEQKLKQAEAAMRTRLETQFKQDLAKQAAAAEKKVRDEAAKQVHQAAVERDAMAKKLKMAEAKEAEIRQQVQADAEKAKQGELLRQKQVLEKDRTMALLKQQSEFNRERESFQKKIKGMEHQLQQKTANQLGDAAEIDLSEDLRAEFSDDRITRIAKGQNGADILQEVMYKGQSCGKIIIDSKNRQAWQNVFVSKLRQDQADAGAEHAILATTVFPSGHKEMCIQSDVIVVSPARVVYIVHLLRQAMIGMYVRGLSMKQRATKMTRLYNLITSEVYNRQFQQATKLAQDILEMDVQEKKAHDLVWKNRGILATRVNSVLREIDTEVSAVIEGDDKGNEESAGILHAMSAKEARQ